MPNPIQNWNWSYSISIFDSPTMVLSEHLQCTKCTAFKAKSPWDLTQHLLHCKGKRDSKFYCNLCGITAQFISKRLLTNHICKTHFIQFQSFLTNNTAYLMDNAPGQNATTILKSTIPPKRSINWGIQSNLQHRTHHHEPTLAFIPEVKWNMVKTNTNNILQRIQ